jgi:phage shock protein C
MFCTKCGIQLRDDDRFCSQCGARTAINRTGYEPPKPLMLDKRNKKIAGVCAGFARYFEVDVTLIRVLWLALAFGTGVGFIGYVIAWIVIPSDHGEWQPAMGAPNTAPVRG